MNDIPKNLGGFKIWEFSSGPTTGEDFNIFAKMFKKFIKKNLPEGSELVSFNKGRYDLFGFIKKSDKFVYFSISDVRHFPNGWLNNILIRTAKSDNDYTGGSNCSTNLENFAISVNGLLR